MSLLTCRHLSVSYDGKAVLSDLNFSVDEGDYLGIVGENGAGKSTLVKALLRLKKPSGGEIVTADGFKPTEIGYLPQQTPVQKDFPASVWEVVLSGRKRRFSAPASRDSGCRHTAGARLCFSYSFLKARSAS